jgi:hypothetical protein
MMGQNARDLLCPDSQSMTVVKDGKDERDKKDSYLASDLW